METSSRRSIGGEMEPEIIEAMLEVTIDANIFTGKFMR